MRRDLRLVRDHDERRLPFRHDAPHLLHVVRHPVLRVLRERLEVEILIVESVGQLVCRHDVEHRLVFGQEDEVEFFRLGVVVGACLGQHRVFDGLAEVDLLLQEAEPHEGADGLGRLLRGHLLLHFAVEEAAEVGLGLLRGGDRVLQRELTDARDGLGDGRDVRDSRDATRAFRGRRRDDDGRGEREAALSAGGGATTGTATVAGPQAPQHEGGDRERMRTEKELHTRFVAARPRGVGQKDQRDQEGMVGEARAGLTAATRPLRSPTESPFILRRAPVKILVPLKRVADPDNANKIKVTPAKVETTGLEWKPNPFDEYAVETALRLTENGASPKARLGEVVVVTFGPKETEVTLRAALATGADRAIRVDVTDDQLDGDLIARALKALVEKEKPDLVLLGKQEVEGDANQVGQLLAEYLGWPQATFAGSIKSEADKALVVGREVDGGTLNVKVTLPAVVTVDLRIVAPKSVQSMHSPAHTYSDGVRFAALMAIMASKKKPLVEVKLTELAADTALKITYTGFEAPPGRKAGVKVKSVQELVQKLKTEAKVLKERWP